MPGTAITNLADLLNNTFPQVNRGDMSQTQKFANYPLTTMFLAKGRAVETVKDGYRYEKRVRLRAAGAFKMASLYEPTPLSVVDVEGLAAIDWKYWDQGSIVFDDREPVFNRGESEILNHLKTKEDAALEDVWNGTEEQLLLSPTSSSDTTSAHGLYYWAPTIATGSTDTVGAFYQNGYYRSSSTAVTTIGNIDASAALNARWRGWAATHNGTFDSTTRAQVTRAMEETNFQRIPEMKLDNGRTGGFYLLVNTSFFLQYEQDANLGPDDRNGDLARFNSNLKFRGIPIIKCSVMDTLGLTPGGTSALNSIMGVNTKHTYGVVVGSDWMQRGKAMNDVESTHVFKVPLTGTFNLFCDNRRNGIFHIHSAW